MNVLNPVTIEAIVKDTLGNRLPGAVYALREHSMTITYGAVTRSRSLHYISGPGRDAEEAQVRQWVESVIIDLIGRFPLGFRPEPWETAHMFDLATAIIRTSGFAPHALSATIDPSRNLGQCLHVSWSITVGAAIAAGKEDRLVSLFEVLTEKDVNGLRKVANPFYYVRCWADAVVRLIRTTKTGRPCDWEWHAAFIHLGLARENFALASAGEVAWFVTEDASSASDRFVYVYRRHPDGPEKVLLHRVPLQQRNEGYTFNELSADVLRSVSIFVELLRAKGLGQPGEPLVGIHVPTTLNDAKAKEEIAKAFDMSSCIGPNGNDYGRNKTVPILERDAAEKARNHLEAYREAMLQAEAEIAALQQQLAEKDAALHAALEEAANAQNMERNYRRGLIDASVERDAARAAIDGVRQGYRDEIARIVAENVALRNPARHPAQAATSVPYDGIKWAEGLIRQLPDRHDGRNSWLMNYGHGADVEAMRDKHPSFRSKQAAQFDCPPIHHGPTHEDMVAAGLVVDESSIRFGDVRIPCGKEAADAFRSTYDELCRRIENRDAEIVALKQRYDFLSSRMDRDLADLDWVRAEPVVVAGQSFGSAAKAVVDSLRAQIAELQQSVQRSEERVVAAERERDELRAAHLKEQP